MRRLAARVHLNAFARLVETHHADMIRLAYVVTCNAAQAEDSVQAAWINAWRKLPSVRDTVSIRPWLLSIAANEARQILRRRRRTRTVELDAETLAGPDSDPAGAIRRLDLVRALARLTPDDRQLVAMRYVIGFEAVELAALTGRSPSGIRTRLSRWTARLRKDLGDD